MTQHSTAQHGKMQEMTVEDMKLTWGLWRTGNSTQNLPLQHRVHTAKCQQHDSTAHSLKLVLPDSFLPAQAVSAGPHSQEPIPLPQAACSDVLGNLLDFLGWMGTQPENIQRTTVFLSHVAFCVEPTLSKRPVRHAMQHNCNSQAVVLA